MNNKIIYPFLIKKTRKTFSPEEDKNLLSLVRKYGETNWNIIAQNMPNRNSRQCRDRWRSYLRPTNLSDEWTEEEDNILLQKYSEFGSRWALIGKFLPQRSDIRIKNRVKLLLQQMKLKSMGIILEKYPENVFKNTALLNRTPYFAFQPQIIINKPVVQYPSPNVMQSNNIESAQNMLKQESVQNNDIIVLPNNGPLIPIAMNNDLNKIVPSIPVEVGNGLANEINSVKIL